jgi:hypothetical protein
MSVPGLSAEQRHVALEQAMAVRAERRRVSEELRAGTMSVADVLAGRASVALAPMKLSAVLVCAVGRRRADAVMDRLDLSDRRRLKGLSDDDARLLLEALATPSTPDGEA